MENKNNRGLIITLIVLLCIVVILLTGLMVFVIFGGSFNIGNIISDTKVIYDESFDKKDINSLKIDSNAGDITIRNSMDDTVRIVARGSNADDFSVENNGDGAKIRSVKPNNVINHFLFIKDNIGTDIDLYLPKDMDIEISSNYGDIKVEGELNGTIKVNNDCGDIEADMLSGKFNLYTNMGDIEISRINITENSSAATNLGNIEIEYTNDIRIESETSLGEKEVNELNPKSDIVLTATTDMGDIDINS